MSFGVRWYGKGIVERWYDFKSTLGMQTMRRVMESDDEGRVSLQPSRLENAAMA
jgi:hypothetical protein